jgi:hypothetical protein
VSERLLVSRRRSVPAPLAEAYAAAWDRLREAADAAGAHAWRFRPAGGGDDHLEFLECRAGSTALASAALRAALDDLDAVAPASEPEEWLGG